MTVGFFGDLKKAAIDANEAAHSARIAREFDDTLNGLRQMEPSMREEIKSRFRDKRQKTILAMGNWTRNGRLRMANTLRTEARKQLDFSVVESYALWMTSAWLECGERQDANARTCYEYFENVARQGSNPVRPLTHDTAYNTAQSFDTWLQKFKAAAAEANPQLKPDQFGGSLIDFMDNAPLHRAYKDNVDPNYLGREFGRTFDPSTFGR
jgi:hypothetical protein